jgi:outer membrane protein assembly factor BamB
MTMSNIALRLAVLLLGLLTVGQASPAADWNQWRGPGRDGRVVGFQPPARWPAALERRWKITVGEGHSSPLIVGESAYIFSRQGEEEVVRRLDLATGRELWRVSYPAPYEMNPAARGHGKGPKSTPVCHNGRLFTLGISGILTCINVHNGKVIWRQHFRQFEHTSPLYGTAMSPLVENGLLIAHVGGHNGGALVCLNPNTGAKQWEWSGDGPGYASPIVATIGGVRQIITQSQKMCISLDIKTGKLLWSIPFTTPYDQNIVTPVLIKDLVVFGGIQQPTFAVKIERSGDRWTTRKVWETREVTLYMSSPIVQGDYLIGMTDRRRGQMFVLEGSTGKTLWSNEGRMGDNAAILDLAGAILSLTNDATLRIWTRQGGALSEAARYTVADSPTWATPAIQGNRILIKDENSLALWVIPGAR